jgi:hypothetical protein
MTALKLVIALALACPAVVVAARRSATDNDSLVPVQQSDRYNKILNSKLQATPSNYGRVTIALAFDGESSLAIYCGTHVNGAEKCHTTYVMAEENLYQRTDAGLHPEKAASIQTSRVDAEISANTAKTIREIWSRVLQATQSHNTSAGRWVHLPVDATAFVFSLDRPGARPLRGELDLFLPDLGIKTKELVRLAHELIDYCKAALADRPALAAKIDRDANRLLAQLKGGR